MGIGQRVKAAIQAFNGQFEQITEDELNAKKPFPSNGAFNQYRSYPQQIAAIYHKYNNNAEYGCQFVKTIVDYRAAWILGKVPSFTVDGEQENIFLNQFLDYNNWKGSALLNYARLGEKEGKVLSVLFDEKVGSETFIKVRPYKYILYNYSPIFDDSYNITGIKLKTEYNKKEVIINSSDFVLTFLSGDKDIDITQNLITPPRLAHVLSAIDNIDKAELDRRKINEIFSKPTPFINLEDRAEMIKVRNYINATKWKIGEAMILWKGQFSFPGIDLKGVESLQKEILNNIQRISGHTGIPVFLLGYPELMNGRATAAEFAESINVMTTTERTTWESDLKLIIQKAMIMYNRKTNSYLNPTTVKVIIPEVAISQVKLLMDTLVEMKAMGIISTQTLLEKNPYVQDPKLEMQRLQDEKTSSDSATSQIIQDGLNKANG